MIYIDLKEAIHFIIRQLSIGGSISDALLAKVCARFGLPVDVLHDLHHHLGGPAAIHEANLPDHVKLAVGALHVDTFFQVRGQRDYGIRNETG